MEEKEGDTELAELAEAAIMDKREDSGSEVVARELYDVPSSDPGSLAAQQEEGEPA